MLEKLFGSRARVKLLKLFLLNPKEKYYIRQLARKLDLQLNSVRRELENLEKFGLLVSNMSSQASKDEARPAGAAQAAGKDNNKQEKKYFQANQNFILYEEIKALIVKAQILYEKDFISKLQGAGKIKLLILTGLFVNNFDAATDLLIVGKIDKEKFLKLISELERDLGKEINFTLMDEKEFKYRKDITDVFLYEILEGRRMTIVDEL